MRRRKESKGSYLQAGEELIGVLVLAHIGGFPVIVLKRLPEALGHKVWPVAQRQVAKGSLRRTHRSSQPSQPLQHQAFYKAQTVG
jgi:hypothetical protein